MILILGVDGLDANLCHRYGFEFLDKGYLADYKSRYWSTVPSWTSIYTGMTREEHGCPPGWRDWLYNQVNTVHVDGPKDGEYAPIKYEKPYSELPFIWKLLNYQGKTTGVFGMPLTFPAHVVKGWMVSGFPAVNNPRAVYPREAYLKDYAPDIFQLIDQKFITNFKTIKGFIKEGNSITAPDVIEHVKGRLENLEALLTWQRPDVLFVGYSFLDHIGHLGLVTEKDQEAVYKLVDWCIAETFSLVGADAAIIVSDHGGETKTINTFNEQITTHPAYKCFDETRSDIKLVGGTFGPWEHTENGVFWMTEKPDEGRLYEYDVTRHILRLAKQFT